MMIFINKKPVVCAHTTGQLLISIPTIKETGKNDIL
jgi:hypothetical protein